MIIAAKNQPHYLYHLGGGVGQPTPFIYLILLYIYYPFEKFCL